MDNGEIIITADTKFGDVRDIRIRCDSYKISVTHNLIRKPSKCHIRIKAENPLAPSVSYGDYGLIISYPYAPMIPQEILPAFIEALTETRDFCERIAPVLDTIKQRVENFEKDVI